MGSFINDPLYSGFEPIPELNRTDADVTVWALHNRVLYTDAVLDPWFKSTTNFALGTANLWRADMTLAVLGCTEQYQFCNTQENCTKLGPLQAMDREEVAKIGYNPTQLATFDLIWDIAFGTRLFNIIFFLQDNVLLAKDKTYGDFSLSPGLPEDQWQLELQNVHNISLAYAQQLAVTHASPENIDISPDVTLDQYIVKENTTESLTLCRNQKIKSAFHYSFSIFGLSSLLVGSFISILLGNFAAPITEYLRKKFRFGDTYPTEEWMAGNVLQLQRIALEAYGIKLWKDSHGFPFPVEGTAQKFRLPWLTEWSEKSFYIDDENGLDTRSFDESDQNMRATHQIIRGRKLKQLFHSLR
jgi:hypothetical protein